MALARTRLLLGIDARAVCAATLQGVVGEPRLKRFARVPLAPGALSPSPAGQNLQRPEEVADALRRALPSPGPGRRATLVLPDGLARLALFRLPADADARDYVRFRLGPSLSWPAAEAIVDVLGVGRGLVIGAALRRGAVEEYEQAVRSLGLEIEGVHLAPLLAAQAALRSGPREAVHVVLGDAAVCFVALRRGRPAVLRNRRRDRSPGEAARLLEEAERTARLAADGEGESGSWRLVLAGSDAVQLRRELQDAAAGEPPRSTEWPEAAEAAWLAGLLR